MQHKQKIQTLNHSPTHARARTHIREPENILLNVSLSISYFSQECSKLRFLFTNWGGRGGGELSQLLGKEKEETVQKKTESGKKR